ncbi:uncharacterized protein LOC123194451 [Mangifera indica]|uniref:uncharacterized protein LOC123194451 n=1 Tax=Mangifera indica TaxID=29780 RepID=UPI001CF95F56|nr:uncharacterized protein LOC123194451 [Mangifera indica]
MAYKHVGICLQGSRYYKAKHNEALHLTVMLYHCPAEPPNAWYEKVFPKITRLSQLYKNVDLIDGRLVNVKDDSVVIDERVESRMRTFKSFVRVFLGCPSVQRSIQKNVVASLGGSKSAPLICFDKPSEREPLVVNSLTKVSNYLKVSAQQRKSVRLTICPQVTQHRIWTGALEEILNGLKLEIDLLNDQCPSQGTKMGRQIVSTCLKFLADTDTSNDLDSMSWMKLNSAKVVDSPVSSKWEEALEMVNDLIKCLDSEKGLLHHVSKLEAMREGLSQIKDVLVDKHIGYKEIRHQESLVHKKLSKTLGHSSQCLFTLLLYYLYGQVRDIEVDVCGNIYASGEKRFTLCMGRILTSGEEKMVWRGVKQLDRALGLFKFIWETASMEGALDLQGHLWCVGAEERSLTYRGNSFFLCNISL